MGLTFPRIYPILDSSFIPSLDRTAFLSDLGRSLADAGILLLEYRNKSGTDAEVLADALNLRAVLPKGEVKLVMDDRIDVAMAAEFDGVHVDDGDLSPSVARMLLGQQSLIGTSAGSEAELLKAFESAADYIAFGPVFPTTTKRTPVNPMGIRGVKRFRQIADRSPVRPGVLVAAAGISFETAAEVIAAGADCVAVAAGIFATKDPGAEFYRWRLAFEQPHFIT